MDKRRVVVLIRHAPLGSLRCSEALRHCVGLSLAENHVTVVLLDAAAWLATPMTPQLVEGGELKKHLDTLRLLKMRVVVERESLITWGVSEERVGPGVEVLSFAEVVDDITNAEVVYAF